METSFAFICCHYHNYQSLIEIEILILILQLHNYTQLSIDGAVLNRFRRSQSSGHFIDSDWSNQHSDSDNNPEIFLFLIHTNILLEIFLVDVSLIMMVLLSHECVESK